MRRILAGRYPSPSPGAKLITNHHASCSDEQPIGASSIVNRINQQLPLFIR
ncbi:hypothetical protein [Psychrobacter frigidicola]|uniref:hypothetical protein n=1 Tax=Psychrobacter frigidicola TaxID=45611 RepID=UPI0019196CF1|nr:hypothetical protein [Psychrobacter frigidicola]